MERSIHRDRVRCFAMYHCSTAHTQALPGAAARAGASRTFEGASRATHDKPHVGAAAVEASRAWVARVTTLFDYNVCAQTLIIYPRTLLHLV